MLQKLQRLDFVTSLRRLEVTTIEIHFIFHLLNKANIFFLILNFISRIPLISSFRNPAYDQSDSAGEPIVSNF